MKINMKAFTEGFEKRGSEKVAVIGAIARGAASVGKKILSNPMKSAVAGVTAADVASTASSAAAKTSRSKLLSF